MIKLVMWIILTAGTMIVLGGLSPLLRRTQEKAVTAIQVIDMELLG